MGFDINYPLMKADAKCSVCNNTKTNHEGMIHPFTCRKEDQIDWARIPKDGSHCKCGFPATLHSGRNISLNCSFEPYI
jgi:hypothetical protein